MPREFVPHDYQQIALDHILSTKRNALWASMGLGKTSVCLTAIDNLQLVEPEPVLVLAPKRVAATTWPDEAAKWSHLQGLDVTPILGSADERKAALKADSAVFTMNYENLPWLIEHYGKNWPFKTIIADESTRLKSYRSRGGSKRARALAKICHSHVDRFIELTGTPSPNGLIDLWGQAYFLDGGERLGYSFGAFKDRWFKSIQVGAQRFAVRLEPHDFAQEQIQERLSDICLTLDAHDYFDIAKPIITDVYVELPSKARTLYDKMQKEMFFELGNVEVEAMNAASKTIKCLQLANGAIYTDGSDWQPLHDVKLQAVESIIEESAGMPVLVAYHFKSDLARLQAAFKQGKVLDSDPQTIRDWNAGKIPILFAHPACLHADTEVLTEQRGWVKIVEVGKNERVFDGIEFVNHSGCSFSGVREVTDLFGITLTLNHKLLINGEWAEAKDVRNNRRSKNEARYAYKGNDAYLGEMLPLRRDTNFGKAARSAKQSPTAQKTYSEVYDLVDCGPRNRFLIRNADGDVFISHNSAGHGLNLQDGGNILVVFGHWWNLEEYQQIVERIGPTRQAQAGHKRPVFIYHIIAHATVDELIMERRDTKRSVQDILLNAMKRK